MTRARMAELDMTLEPLSMAEDDLLQMLKLQDIEGVDNTDEDELEEMPEIHECPGCGGRVLFGRCLDCD